MKKILYLGLDPPSSNQNEQIIHYPIIKIIPEDPKNDIICQSYKELPFYTHLIFTSKSAVEIFFKYLPLFCFDISVLRNKELIAIGAKTAKKLEEYGTKPANIASEETLEGIIKLIEDMPLQKPYFFWPHSALSRDVLTAFFEKSGIKFKECKLYNTILNIPSTKPDLSSIDEIFFTSPSTVEAFLQIFGEIPADKIIRAIGPVTKTKLVRIL